MTALELGTSLFISSIILDSYIFFRLYDSLRLKNCLLSIFGEILQDFPIISIFNNFLFSNNFIFLLAVVLDILILSANSLNPIIELGKEKNHSNIFSSGMQYGFIYNYINFLETIRFFQEPQVIAHPSGHSAS